MNGIEVKHGPNKDTRLHELSRREHVMDGRVVLITGAGQRLGAATATRLMDEGCYVLIHVRSSVDSAMSLIEESKARNGEIRGAVLQADLTVDEDVSRLILEVKNHPKVVASGLYGLVHNLSLIHI